MSGLPTVVIDNGAASIKAGVIGADRSSRPQARIVSNAIVRSKGDNRTYIGHELESCRDHSSLHYRLPFEKGYLVDWDAEKAIWDGLFSNEVLGVNTTEASLLITGPYFDLPNLQETYDQFVFEEYEFQSYYRCTPASLIPHGNIYSKPGLSHPDCMVVIDSGFSFTHVVPLMNGSIVWNAVRRLDVGGKLLTNHLKELASFRQWNMMDETYIMNEVKEACCYVSSKFREDLETCRAHPKANPIVEQYVLPDLSVNRAGHVRTPDEALDETSQVLYMNNERFTVPEILFRPGDIGLEQSGIAATIASSIALMPEDLQGMFWEHICLVGGNAKFPGFSERLLSELRSLAPVDYEVVIHSSDDPILEAYNSAVNFASKADFPQQVVTREEYLESGSQACRRKFRDWRSGERDATKGREQAKGRETARNRVDDGADQAGSTSTAKKAIRGKGRGRVARR